MTKNLEDIPTKDEFTEELTQKFIEKFPTLVRGQRRNSKVLHKFDILDRLGIETVIYDDLNLQSARRFMITPLDSEILLQRHLLPGRYREYLALLLYDRSSGGANEPHAEALYQDVKQYRSSLGLSVDDLNSRLLIQRAGLTYDGNMPYGVRPSILPGVTQIFTPEVLNSGHVPAEFTFNIGIDHGLPHKFDYIRSSQRILRLPFAGDTGLRVLTRLSDNNLDATVTDLRTNKKGKITFVHKDSNGIFL